MERQAVIKWASVAATLATLAACVCASVPAPAPTDVAESGAEAPETPFWLQEEPYLDFPVNDVPAPVTEPQRVIPTGYNMPLYLQDDPQWGYIEYAGSDIANAGCGLVAASMAIEYLTNQITYPRDLAGVVGDSCLTDGVNDPGKFCAYAEEAYGIEGSDIYWTFDEALAECVDGSVVLAGMSGQIAGQGNWYGGHVVLLWRGPDGEMRVRDPGSGENSQRPYTTEELRATGWKYFYTLSIK